MQTLVDTSSTDGALLSHSFPAVELFDLDHALLSCNCSFRFGRYLYDKGSLRSGIMLPLLAYYGAHVALRLPLATLHAKSFDLLFYGKRVEVVKQDVRAFLDQDLGGMLFPPLLQRLVAAQKSGHYTAILSSSPDFLVQEIAQRLQVHDYLATNYVSDSQGVFRSVSRPVSGEEKAEYVRTLQHRGTPMEQIVAYSDSILDLPFLRAAGVSVGVRPDRRLRKECRRQMWEIIP